MASCLRRLPWLLLAAAACSSHPGPGLRIVIAHSATTDERCVLPGAAAPLQDDTLVSNGVATVRLSVREHMSNDRAGAFVCDRVFGVREVPTLQVHKTSGATTFDLYGEAFAAATKDQPVPRRIAVGALLDVPLGAGKLPDLRLYRDEAFGCVNARMQRPRAFHSATLLPDGRLLIVGGLTANGADPTVETFVPAPVVVAQDVELYDPSTGTFSTVSEAGGATGPSPRAFHQAALINDAPPYQILLVGGITVADTTTPALGINSGAGSGTRLIPFDTSGTLFSPLTTKAASAELLTYDPASHSVTHAPVAGFPAATFAAGASVDGGLVVADGIDWMGMPLAAMTPQIKQATVARVPAGMSALEMPRSGATVSARMGATLTPLSSNSALLWGGQINPADPAGELMSGLDPSGTVKLASVTLATAPVTQFHTATALDADSSGTHLVLVTGGFVQTNTNMGQALEPPTGMPATMTPVRILTVTATGAVSSAEPATNGFVGAICDASAANRYRPAGWEAAVLLPRGRVLVTGGAPTAPSTGVTCNDCDSGNTFLCATKQAALFTAPSSWQPKSTLQVPRFGHTATLMHDGNVLLVGGIGGGGVPRVLGDAEVYNPRPEQPEYTPGSGMPDPDDPITSDLGDRPPRAPAATLGSASECGQL
jgi:hypothetical protein